LPGAGGEPLHRYAQTAAVAVVVVGCYLVLHPVVPAILFAAVICTATWPLYIRLRAALWSRSGLAALAMTVMLLVLVIGPSVLLAANLASNGTALFEAGKAMLRNGPMEPPGWLLQVPVAGELLADYWKRLASGSGNLTGDWKGLLDGARAFLVGAGKAAGEGLLQLALASFVAFFLYRDGDALMLATRRSLDRIAGKLGNELLATLEHTVTGVILAVFGTALAQGLVALTGFLIAGVPAPFLLAAATFFLSILPIGPPMVWGGATAWLVLDGQLGWAVFMAAWGLLAISTIDNLVKPYLISRTSNLPLVLTVLGMFGGVIAFGFIGLFIGPPMLAVGLALAKLWVSRRLADAAAPG